MKNATSIVSALVAVLLTALLVGCGGGTGPEPTGPPPPTGTAQIQGEVQGADNPDVKIGYAEVSAQPAAVTTSTDTQGCFTLRNLPAGNTALHINPLHHPDYQPQTLLVPAAAGQTTMVMINVLPSGTATPAQITLAPSNPSVEVGGGIDFGSVMTTATDQLQVNPSWLLTGGIGTITAAGYFQALVSGTGTLTAVVGDVSTSTIITVIPPQPPDISTVIVSPFSLPPSGGLVSIVAAICDGQGIGVDAGGNPRVQACITLPGGGALPPLLMDRDAGTSEDGTYRTTYNASANDNTPNPWGIQAPQIYTLRIEAWDTTGKKSTSAAHSLTVQGLAAPPVPPPG